MSGEFSKSLIGYGMISEHEQMVRREFWIKTSGWVKEIDELNNSCPEFQVTPDDHGDDDDDDLIEKHDSKFAITLIHPFQFIWIHFKYQIYVLAFFQNT